MAGGVGTSVIDFGSSLVSDATLVITGQTSITAGSFCEAWIDPTQGATADHTVDEQMVEPIRVFCTSIVAGTGFTIRAICDGVGTYGKYNVSWVWA